MTLDASSGFIYAASTMGVTGARDAVSSMAPELTARIRAHSDIPVASDWEFAPAHRLPKSRHTPMPSSSARLWSPRSRTAWERFARSPKNSPRASARLPWRRDLNCGPAGLYPQPAPSVWYVGPVALRAYALFIILGIIVAIVWGDRRWVARGGEKGTVLDIAIWAVPFGLIGGRLYHVLTDWPAYFGENGQPLDALKVWQGGLGIWGAVFLGGIGAWIGCRRRGIPVSALGDAIAPGILLAQAIGRIGNYFNQELYGRETTVPWGLEIFERVNSSGQLDQLAGVSNGEVIRVVHPTFLYEAVWNVLIVILLVLVDRRFKIGHGRLFALYVAGYCLGRFVVELMRDDFAYEIAGIRVNTFTSGIVFFAALAYFFLAKKGREDPADLKSKDYVAAVAAGEAGVAAPVTETDSAKADAEDSESDAAESASSEASASTAASDESSDAVKLSKKDKP